MPPSRTRVVGARPAPVSRHLAWRGPGGRGRCPHHLDISEVQACDPRETAVRRLPRHGPPGVQRRLLEGPAGTGHTRMRRLPRSQGGADFQGHPATDRAPPRDSACMATAPPPGLVVEGGPREAPSGCQAASLASAHRVPGEPHSRVTTAWTLPSAARPASSSRAFGTVADCQRETSPKPRDLQEEASQAPVLFHP